MRWRLPQRPDPPFTTCKRGWVDLEFLCEWKEGGCSFKLRNTSPMSKLGLKVAAKHAPGRDEGTVLFQEGRPSLEHEYGLESCMYIYCSYFKRDDGVNSPTLCKPMGSCSSRAAKAVLVSSSLQQWIVSSSNILFVIERPRSYLSVLVINSLQDETWVNNLTMSKNRSPLRLIEDGVSFQNINYLSPSLPRIITI